MIRLIIMIVFFLLSLLTVFPAPTNLLWYVSILVTEFCWVFFLAVPFFIFFKFSKTRYNNASLLIGVFSMALFTVPLIQAYQAAAVINKIFSSDLPVSDGNAEPGYPYSFWRMFSPTYSVQARYETITYDSSKSLTLDYYRPRSFGGKPCIVVVHGGSWAGGDSRQLPELNAELAKAGYPVVTINYRLAPTFTYPAPVEDVKTCLSYLRKNGYSLGIDTGKFILLGRSAGGQIVLSAAYTLNDPAIKGVISFYGPVDMVWGYANPSNPLVLDSRKVMENYLGGTYDQVPQQYINSSGNLTVTRKAVPTLLIHGEHDPLVSYVHAVILGKKLDSLGVKHYDVYLPWATHGFDWSLNGPGGQLSTWCVMRFLNGLKADH